MYVFLLHAVTATTLPVVLKCNPGLYFTIEDISVTILNGKTKAVDTSKAMQQCESSVQKNDPNASCEVSPTLGIPETDMKSITVRYYCWKK